jgi:hypothetical protein
VKKNRSHEPLSIGAASRSPIALSRCCEPRLRRRFPLIRDEVVLAESSRKPVAYLMFGARIEFDVIGSTHSRGSWLAFNTRRGLTI